MELAGGLCSIFSVAGDRVFCISRFETFSRLSKQSELAEYSNQALVCRFGKVATASEVVANGK